jgi:hypothetical protein
MPYFRISADARSRLNAIMIISVCFCFYGVFVATLTSNPQLFIGQVIGTAAGTKVFVLYGWRAGAALSMGFYGLQLVVLFARGPHVGRYTWFGYEGGLEARNSVIAAREKKRAEDEEAAAAEPVEKGEGQSVNNQLTSLPGVDAAVGEKNEEASRV